MEPFNRALAGLLAYVYELVPNYAAAITIFTIIIMFLLLPFTLKQTRSMLALQRLAPEIKLLQDKHKNDRQKLNEEMMLLYRENKINPLGCVVPMLLQLPVFFILYSVINGLTRHLPNGQISPRYLDHDTLLYKHLVEASGKMESFGMDLALAATDRHSPALTAVPFFVLIVVMVLAQYWQQWQITSRSPSTTDSEQAQAMRKLQKVFPPMFGLISLGFPAALVLYWTVSSLFRVFQQWAMYRFDPVLKHTVAHAKEEVQHFLEEDDAGGRAQKGGSRSSGNAKRPPSKNKKKRKGR